MKELKHWLSAAALTGAILVSAMTHASAQTLTGAGSSFVNPIMTQWIAAYSKKTGATINYQPIGSGGGINALINHTVDFAGSDVPMNPNELGQAGASVIHIPDVVGAVVVAYHIPGIGPGLRFNGSVLSDIYLGKITSWSDPQIAALNPGVKFPSESIFVTHRSDGSGTTAIFTDYLCKVNSAWKNGPGTGKSVEWPTGLGAKGSAGVAGLVTTHNFSIGYVELAYATQNNISYAEIDNAHGKPIYPSPESALAAADSVKLSSNNTASITNSPSPKGYPIAGYSYLIVYKKSAKAKDLKDFLSFVIGDGQDESFTKPLYYGKIPAAAKSAALKDIQSIQ